MIHLNDRKLIESIKTRNNEKNKLKVYPVKVLNNPITLVKALGVTLVSLKCTDFATNRGCNIDIEYPSNIAIGSFKIFKAKLSKVGGKWQLSHNNKKFTQLHLIARKAFGILIGIKRIEAR